MKSSQYVSLLTLTLVAAGSMTLMAAVSPDAAFKPAVNNYGATCPKIRLGLVGSTAMVNGISSMSVSADGEGCPFSSKSSGSCCSASATASTSSCCSAGASVATAIASAAKASASSCCENGGSECCVEGAACCAEGKACCTAGDSACCEGAKKNTAATTETVVASPETGAAATSNN